MLHGSLTATCRPIRRHLYDSSAELPTATPTQNSHSTWTEDTFDIRPFLSRVCSAARLCTARCCYSVCPSIRPSCADIALKRFNRSPWDSRFLTRKILVKFQLGHPNRGWFTQRRHPIQVRTKQIGDFWATVCKNGSPYAIGPLYVLSVCLSVCDVGVFWANS